MKKSSKSRLLFLFLAIVMVLCIFSITAAAEGDNPVQTSGSYGPPVQKYDENNNLYWDFSDNIVWNYSSDGTLSFSGVGAMSDGYLNTNPTPPTPWNTMEINNIVIGPGITNVGAGLANSFSYLTTVELPETITSIGDNAFHGCRSLSEINIPNSVQSIGAHAFDGCSGITAIDLGTGLHTIGEYAFANMDSLTSIVIPAGVTKIPDNCFHIIVTVGSGPGYDTATGYYHGGLTSITLHDNIEYIGQYAFCDTSLISVDIPAKVDKIGDCAFQNCYELQNVTLHEGLREIGEYAFYDCLELTGVTLPDTLTTIGESAFAHCNSLAYATLSPDSRLSSMGANCFQRTSLPDFTVPSGVTRIEDGTFSNGSSTQMLSNVTLHDGITYIGSSAFGGCQFTNFTVPAGLTEIGTGAFHGCANLETISFEGCGVTELPANVFSDCTKLESIVFPNGLQTIGSQAFYSCDELLEVEIPNTVTSIGYQAFCYGGTKRLTIPASVTTIGGDLMYPSIYSYTDACIRTPYGSTAMEYAINNRYSLELIMGDSGIEVAMNDSLTNRINMMTGDLSLTVTTNGAPTLAQKAQLPNTVDRENSLLVEVAAAVGETELRELSYGIATVTIPYDTESIPDGNTLSVFVLPEEGAAQPIAANKVTVGSGQISFEVNQFSDFAISRVTHEHAYSTQWSSDENGHWHACTAPDCPNTDHTENSGYASHSAPDDDGDCTTAITCDVCGYVFTAAREEHSFTADSGIKVSEATCTQPQKNKTKCEYCDEVSDTITVDVGEALGHETVTDAAVPATCTEAGKTEGSHCSRCEEIIAVQETVNALGHDLVHHAAQVPTCTATGWEEYDSCSRCSYTTYVQLPTTEHTFTVYQDNATHYWHKCQYCSATDTPVEKDLDAKYALTVTSGGNGKATTTNGATPAVGERVYIYARENEGYFFKEWQVVSGNVSLSNPSAASTDFIMPDEPVELKAIFKENNTLSIIWPFGTETKAVRDGEIYTLFESNYEGKSFAGWNIVSGDAEISFASFYWLLTVHSGDVTVEAIYEDAYEIITAPGNDGIYIELAQSTAIPGERVELKPSTEYTPIKWNVLEGDVEILENNEPYSYFNYYFIMPEGNVVISVEYDKDPNVSAYKVNLVIEGKGEVWANPEGYIELGETVSLYDYPSEGYVLQEFQVLSGGITINYDTENDKYEFVMPNNDVTIKAIYERDPAVAYLLEITTDDDLYCSYDIFDTTDGRRFVDLYGVGSYSGNTFFKEWQVIKGEHVELGEYTIEYFDTWAPEGFSTYTFYGFYVPENEDVEVRAVAYPFEHDVHDWQYESVDASCHRKYCECGPSVQEMHSVGDEVVIQEATHTQDGIVRHFCGLCDYYRDEIIERIPDHEFYGGSPFCTVCGAIQTNASKVTSDEGTSTTTVKENTADQLILPQNILDTVAAGNSLVIEMRDADVALSDEVVAAVKGQSGDLDIAVQVSGDEVLTAEQKSGIPTEYNNGEMVVVSIEASVGGNALHELGGLVTLTVPYDTASIPIGQKVTVYYIPESGEAELIENVTVGDGFVSFTTDHFSSFALGLVEDDIFTSINISLASDINVNFYAKANDTTVARFTMNGTTVTVDGEIQPNGEYKYVFTGVAPQFIGDTITAELVDGETVIASKEYSVLKYLNKLRGMTAEKLGYTSAKYSAMQMLINDLLVYGAAVQNYADYKTDALVSEGVTGSAFIPIVETDLHLANNGANATFTSATVNFNNINRMKIYFTAENTEGLVIKYKIGDGEEQEIGYASDGNGRYAIITPGILASDFTNVYTFIAYKDNVAGATLTYSVKSYVYAKQNSANTAMADLAKATYNYGVAAKAFVDAD